MRAQEPTLEYRQRGIHAGRVGDGSLNIELPTSRNATYGFRTELSWTLMSGGRGHKASKLKRKVSTSGDLSRPPAPWTSRLGSERGLRHGYRSCLYEGSKYGKQQRLPLLASSFKATAIAVSIPVSSCVNGWDIGELKGKVAIIAVAGGGDGVRRLLTLTHKARNTQGLVGRVAIDHAGMPNLGNIVFMKTIGFVDLDIKGRHPSALRREYGASTEWLLGRTPVYMGTGNGLISWAERSLGRSNRIGGTRCPGRWGV